MEIKVNVGDPKSKRTVTLVMAADDAKSIFGKRISDTIRGELVGKPGYELQITGGSDNAGFPMRRDVIGSGRRKILATYSTGQRGTKKGVRIRKTVAGNTVSEFTSQLNVKVIKHGPQPLVEEKAEEAKSE